MLVLFNEGRTQAKFDSAFIAPHSAMAKRKRNNYRLDVLSKLLLRHKKDNEKKEQLEEIIKYMFPRDRLPTGCRCWTPVLFKPALEVTDLWAPTPDGVWERAGQEAVRMLDEARARADRWIDADDK